MLPFCWTMRYNRNILKQSQTKGAFYAKGGPKKQYTPELKIKVVETMQRERMSYREAALQFNIPQGNKMVAKWERIYLEE